MNVVRRGQWQRLPEIVPIVLNEIARLRECGQISQQEFDEKLERLAVEEIAPRGCEVVVRESSDDSLRFAIKDLGTGEIYELIECVRGNQHPDGNAMSGAWGDGDTSHFSDDSAEAGSEDAAKS